jgi:hypothetical protein
VSRSNPKIIDGGLSLDDPCDKYVGIDQSYSGFAITVLSAKGTFHTEVFEAPGRGVDRLSAIQLFIGDLLGERTTNVKGSAMEGYAYGAQMAHMAGELGGLVKIELKCWLYYEDNAKYPLIIPPAMLKKYVTGKGQGVKKNQILLSVYKKWGVEFMDDNAADSYALARIAAGIADLEYEKEIITKTLDPKYREIPKE